MKVENGCIPEVTVTIRAGDFGAIGESRARIRVDRVAARRNRSKDVQRRGSVQKLGRISDNRVEKRMGVE